MARLSDTTVGTGHDPICRRFITAARAAAPMTPFAAGLLIAFGELVVELS
jgi:hypothetical protein